MSDEPHDQKPVEPPRPPRGGLVAAGILIMATILLAVVVLGGMWLTGLWSGPSHDDPRESVDGFLTAMLEDRDGEDARGYLCQTLVGDVDATLSMIDTMAEAEDGDTTTQFSWSDITEHSRSDSTAVVTANVTHDLTGESAEWTFAVVNGDPDDAWRVCGIDPGTDEES